MSEQADITQTGQVGEAFDALSAEQQLQHLEDVARRALPAWGIRSDSPLRLLSLSENATYRVGLGGNGPDRILRVHRTGYHTRNAVRSELAWMKALQADEGLATPQAIPAINGEAIQSIFTPALNEERFAVLFELIPGESPDESSLLEPFKRLGAVTARMHKHARQWQKPDYFERLLWDFDGCLGKTPLWGDWRLGFGLDDAGKAVLEQVQSMIEQRLAAFGHGPDRFGLIHADLRLANLLESNNETRVIDFDDTGFGWFMYDIASALSFIETRPDVPQLIEAWVQGYRSQAALSDEEVAEIPTFIMLRRMTLVAWLASHPNTIMARTEGVSFTRETVTLGKTYLQKMAAVMSKQSDAVSTKQQPIRPILEQNACDFHATGNDQLDALVQERLATMGPTSVLFYREPLEMVRGEGAWLFNSAGERFLDAYNNVAVLGHSHPAITAAVSQQLGLLNTHSRYLNRAGHGYAQQLLSTLPLENSRLLLTCTGSEANDLAIRLAQAATGAHGIIVSEAAYHGNTYLVNQVSPSSCRSIPDWVATFSLDALRNEQLSLAEACASIRSEIQQAIQQLQLRGYQVAALLADSVFSSDGIFTEPAGFLAAAVDEVRAAGGVFIADEVQPGFGRCGDTFWGFMHHSSADEPLIPEIVTFGKPMGNGYPVSGLVTGEHLLKRLADGDGYFNTFAGTNVAIAAAQAVLDTLEKEQLQHNAAVTGAYIKQELLAMQAQYPVIKAVRGRGFFIGVDLHFCDDLMQNAQSTSDLINRLRSAGVLIGAAGKDGATLKIRPPLCLNQQQAELFVNTLRSVL